MKNKYDLQVTRETLNKDLKRIINLTYKLLPMREEGSEWDKLLENLIEELVGMSRLLFDLQSDLFVIICKMEGLFSLTKDENMALYRRTIFECLSLLNRLPNSESFR